MKKLKNKLFYVYSLIFYLILVFIFVILSDLFLKPTADSFAISNFAANKMISLDVMEIVIDDFTDQKYLFKTQGKDMTADILDYFYTYAKPKVVALDMTFTSVNNNLSAEDKKCVDIISKMNNLVSGFSPEYVYNDEDAQMLVDFEKNHALNVKLYTKFGKSQFNGVKSASDILRNSTKHYGSVYFDSEFVFDNINIIRIKDAYYPSLAFKTYLLANNTNEIVINDDYISVPKTGLKFKYKYDKGIFLSPIRYYHFPSKMAGYESNYSHWSMSASRILDTYKALKSGVTPENSPQRYAPKNNDLIDPAMFKDKIIFIGTNISGENADLLRTPIQNSHPGVDIHATVFDNFQNNTLLNETGINVTALLIALLCIPAFILIVRTTFIRGILFLFLLDILYLTVVFTLAWNGILTSYSTPLVCQFVTAVFGYTFKFLSESRNKEKIKQAMGKYISQDVMKNVVKNIDDLQLGGKRAVVTVLFSDIRGFTSLSEKMPAEEVSMILNEYFGQMEPIITKYNGVINKFIGDAVMAIFGEPIQDINHPQNAVKCAYEMLKKVEYLREKWLFEGKPRIEIGVGINTGEAFIGNIGTDTRMEYTVIGDTVNLASRIEGYNKVYKTNLLVSSTTYNYISDIADVIKIKEVQIRGKSKKMDIYEVLRIDGLKK